MVSAIAEDVMAVYLENQGHGLQALVATAVYGTFAPEQFA